MKKGIIIYQSKSGKIEFRGDLKKDTIWGTQQQIAEVFEIERSVVTKHIGKIIKDKEIDKISNVQKMHFAHSTKPVNLYSLDMILMELQEKSVSSILEHTAGDGKIYQTKYYNFATAGW